MQTRTMDSSIGWKSVIYIYLWIYWFYRHFTLRTRGKNDYIALQQYILIKAPFIPHHNRTTTKQNGHSLLELS